MVGNSCEVEACAECTKRCLRVHRNKAKSSPVIDSFFKVMIGKDYSEVLLLPPKFARTVSALIGRRTIIEDSNRGNWEVTVSNVDGLPAFRQGWNAFSLHHNLEIGDFLVFDYIMGSRFLVKIYDKTGCEKQNFSLNTNKRKRARTTRNSTDRVGQCYTTGKVSMSKQRLRTSVFSGSEVEMSPSQCELNDVEAVIDKITSNCKVSCKRPLSGSRAEFLEDPYYFIDRDLGDQQREDRYSVFDLSHFEMVDNNCGIDKSSKVNVGVDHPHHTGASLRSEFEDVFVNKYPVDEELENRVAAFDASYMEITKNNGVEKMEKMVPCPDTISCNSKISEHLLFPTVVDIQKNGGNSSNVLSGASQTCHSAKEESKALCKSLAEIDRVMVSPMECDQSAQLQFVGQFRESSVQVTTGMQNCQFAKCVFLVALFPFIPIDEIFTTAVEMQKNGGSGYSSSSGVSRKCYGAEEESKAVPKLQTGIHQVMVSQMECTSLSDIKQSMQLKFVGQFVGSGAPVTTGMQNCQFGECMRLVKNEIVKIDKKEPVEIVKKEPEEMIEDTFGNLPQLFKVECGQHSDMTGREYGIPQVVKTDTMDFVHTSAPSAAYTFSVTQSEGVANMLTGFFLGKVLHTKEGGGPP